MEDEKKNPKIRFLSCVTDIVFFFLVKKEKVSQNVFLLPSSERPRNVTHYNAFVTNGF